MPNVYSIGLGGGSLVTFDENGECRIGPQSVGYKLKSTAMCFGGNILTATDIAVANNLTYVEGAKGYLVKIKKEQIKIA